MSNNKVKAILVNNSLTVILTDGTILVNNEGNLELLKKITSATSEEAVLELMAPELSDERKAEKEEIEEIAFNKEIVSNFQILVDTGDFEVIENCVYVKGVNRSIPKELVKRFIDVVNSVQGTFNRDEYQALKNFWFWLVTNPNSEAVEGTFEFIERKNFKIMKNGFLLAYRWVRSKDSENEELASFVSNQYIKVKTKNKKNPSNYNVWQNVDTEDYTLVKIGNTPEGDEETWECKGDLRTLYLEIPNMQEQLFTDGHTGLMSIKIGEEVALDRKLCDEFKGRDCSRGLHAARNLEDYSSFGNVAMLIAINPRNIVSVPESCSSKMRCCAYMPLAVLDKEDYNILDDIDTLELLEEYTCDQIEELEELAKQSDIQELKKNYIISDIKQRSLDIVVNNLNNLKDELSKRIVTL